MSPNQKRLVRMQLSREPLHAPLHIARWLSVAAPLPARGAPLTAAIEGPGLPVRDGPGEDREAVSESPARTAPSGRGVR